MISLIYCSNVLSPYDAMSSWILTTFFSYDVMIHRLIVAMCLAMNLIDLLQHVFKPYMMPGFQGLIVAVYCLAIMR